MTTAPVETQLRTGWPYWWDSYRSMLRWVLIQQKQLFVAMMFTQVVMGIGAAFMYRFYLGELDSTSALFLVTGIPALSLIPVGFLMTPVLVMLEKLRGTFEFTWSLPVPRFAPPAAAFTVFTAIALPVALLSTVLAAWQFGVGVEFTARLVPSAVLAALMGASVGYGLAVAIPEPRITNLITNVVIFLVLLFSPIVIPIERFADWAQTAHRVLPFFHMSNLIRSAMTEGIVPDAATSLFILLGWTALGWALVARVVARRG